MSMFFLKVFALLPLLFAAPEIKVDLAGSAAQQIDVRVTGKDGLLEDCVKSGLSFRYDFQVRICKRRPMWFDTCPEERVEKHALSYDPISGNYRLVIDRFGDDKQPFSKNFSSSAAAARRFSLVRNLPLLFVARGKTRYLHSNRSYLSVRVVSECRGEYNKTVAAISSFLTLGMYRVSGFDTGWVDFKLQRAKTQ